MSLAEEEKVDRGSTETAMRRGNFGRMRSHVEMFGGGKD